MVSETVFYMDIKEAGTVRGGGELFFFLKSFERRGKCSVQGILLRGKMKNAENFDSR